MASAILCEDRVMVVKAMQEIIALLPSLNYEHDVASQLLLKLPVGWTGVAQEITDPKILDRIQAAFHHFVATGQVWALLIGLIIGYVLRGLTTYG